MFIHTLWYGPKSLPFVPSLLLAFLFSSNLSHAVTRTAATNGGWTTAATWSPSGAPAAGDVMIIPAGRTVTVSSNTSYSSSIRIQVSGSLFFSGGGAKLNLPCGSVVEILSGGTLDGNGNGNSQTITICGTTYWSRGNHGRISGPAVYPPNLLPVELLHFNASSTTDAVVCEWSTASERACDRFEVWMADDPALLTRVASIPGQGISNMRVDYTWTDPEPRSGVCYYQLRQIDSDGTTTDLGVRAVHVAAQRLHAWPNPANSVLHISTSDPGAMEVIDTRGRVVMAMPATGEQQVLDVSRLQQGAYYLRPQSGTGEALRFTVMR